MDIAASISQGRCIMELSVIGTSRGFAEWITINGEKVLWLPHEYRGLAHVSGSNMVLKDFFTPHLIFMNFSL
ncbi:uncharacterized protein BDV14DRAFT_171996 [Aspergillus stella-maris]|uniref:uncharacterized protein n=1 Tax=Aspergillus stella-maris TaxID=1810926 RepID=UPI003CCCF552